MKELSLMEEKKQLLNEMLLLTEKQSQAIKDEKIEEFEEILDDKDSIINKIDIIDLNTKDYVLEQIENKDLLNILSEIKDILNKIKTLDDINNKSLSQAMTEMRSNLKEVRVSKRVMSKYGDSDPYQAFVNQGGTLFIDQES